MFTNTFWIMAMYTALGAFLALLAVPLKNRRIKRNIWYGVRLPKTLRDDNTWYEANAYGGRQLLGSGLTTASLAFLLYWLPGLRGNLAAYALACVVCMLAPMIVALTRIMRFVKKL